MKKFRIHNTLGNKLEDFHPIDPSNVRIYACGPTVYNYAHIGNARMAVANDLLINVLRTQYNKVTYVSNITDIDDKIIDAAKAANVEQLVLFHFSPDYNDGIIAKMEKNAINTFSNTVAAKQGLKIEF